MTWFEDLTTYSYLDTEPTMPPTLNVGWLARDRAFSTATAPEQLVMRLQLLREHAPTQKTRGFHPCPFCPDLMNWEEVRGLGPTDLRVSSAEIRAVGANGTRYAAPTLIVHYVSAHAYAPPEEFVDAVLRMQSLSWEHAKANDLCLSCGTKMVQERAMEDPLRRSSAPPPLIPRFSCEGCATSYWR